MMITPAARIAAALAEEAVFRAVENSPTAAAAYAAEVPRAGTVKVVLSKLGRGAGRIEMADGTQAVLYPDNAAFLPTALHDPAEEHLDEAVSLFRELIRKAYDAGGEPFKFGKWTLLGGKGITLAMHEGAAQAVAARPSRFRLFPKPGETRDPERIDRILEKLGEIWKQQPDTRLGQLVSNLSAMANPKGDVYFTEDHDIEKVIDGQLEEKRGTGPRP